MRDTKQWVRDLLDGRYSLEPPLANADGEYEDLLDAKDAVALGAVTWSEVKLRRAWMPELEEQHAVENPAEGIRKAVDYYRELGLTPFPVCRPVGLSGRCYQHKACTSPGKTPLAKAWTQIERNELHDTRIDQLFEQQGYICNIGLRTGFDHNLIVLDIDGEKGRAELEKNGIDVFSMIGDHAAVTTGRIGGYHIWFVPTQLTPKKLGVLDKVDLVGEGGYVLAPGSMHRDGVEYKFKVEPTMENFVRMPDQLSELLAKDMRPKVVCLPLTEDARVKVGQRTLSFLEHGTDSNQREEAVNAVVNLLGRGFDREEIISRVTEALQNSPQLDPRWPWTENDVEKMVESFERQGGPKPALALPEEPTLELPSKPKIQRTRLTAREFLRQQEQADPEPVIEGLIDKGKLHWLWSQAGSGKTLWSLDLAYSIVAGNSYHGRSVDQGNVLLIERDSSNQLWEYLELVRQAGNYDETVLDKLTLAVEEEAHFKDAEGIGYCLSLCDDIEDLKLVIVDAFYAVSPESAAWDARVQPFKRFKDSMAERGVAILVIDHAIKGAEVVDEDGNVMNPLNTLFGGTIKQAIFDIGMYWRGMLKDGVANIQWAKLRTSPRDPLRVTFNEFEGFGLSVKLPDGNIWEGLGRKEVEIVQTILDGGPQTIVEVVDRCRIGKATIMRSYANKLGPRGLLQRNGDILSLGPHYQDQRHDPTLILEKG